MIVVPVRNFVLFPGMVMPVTVGRPHSIAAAQQAVREQRQVGILMQRDADVSRADARSTCTAWARSPTSCATSPHPNGTHHLVCQGEQRFQVVEFLSGWPFLVARVLRIAEPASQVRPRSRRACCTCAARRWRRSSCCRRRRPNWSPPSRPSTQPGALADLAMAYMDVKPDEKQEILETVDVAARMDKVVAAAGAPHRGAAAVGRDRPADQGRARRAPARGAAARADGRDPEAARRRRGRQGRRDRRARQGDRRSRDAEGGRRRRPQGAAPAATHAGSRGRIRHGAHLSRLADRAALEAAGGSADRHRGSAAHPRRGPLRPATRSSGASSNISPCASWRRRARRRSCASSARRASARPRSASRSRAPWAASSCASSLGGVHDEAEIRGHRRTYIGALPGNIIQAHPQGRHPQLRDDARRDRQARRRHPGRSRRRRCSRCSIPEQNNTFRDNYLGVPFDLSRVVFIATANMLDTIPGPLRDRMEVISLAGYTEDEKLQIAKRYLVKRQMEANGLKAGQVEITERRAAEIIARLHARGRRAQSRARDRQGAAPCRGARSPKAPAGPITIDARRPPGHPRARRSSRARSPCAPACRAWRPGSPGRRSAATSCSSRRRGCPATAS